MPEFQDDGWHAHQGEALHLNSNYLNVAENLVDPAHVSFVHPTTLRNTAVGDEAASQQMDAMFKVAFAEDKAILEAIQEEENRPQNRDPVRLLIDKGSTVYRKRIQDLIEAESQMAQLH